MIEELKRVLKPKNIYLNPLGENKWKICDKEYNYEWGIFYISSKGHYEFNLAKTFTNQKFLKEIKQDIARVISQYDDYAY